MRQSSRTELPDEEAASYRKSPLFAVSLAKLAILSLCTFGIYEWYWFLQQWRSERERTQEKFSPMLRALLAPFFAFGLFRRIHDLSVGLGLPPKWPAFTLGLVYLILTFAWLLSLGAFSNLSVLSFLPLLVVQHTANQLNRAAAPEVPRNDKYSSSELAIIVVGIVPRAVVIWVLRELGDLMTILESMTQ